MAVQIRDRAALKRLRKLLTTLDSGAARFPVTLYLCSEDQTAAFMEGSEREFLVATEEGRPVLKMSDREEAEAEWEQREMEVLNTVMRGLADNAQDAIGVVILPEPKRSA